MICDTGILLVLCLIKHKEKCSSNTEDKTMGNIYIHGKLYPRNNKIIEKSMNSFQNHEHSWRYT